MTIQVNKKKIATNTVALYLRLLFSVAISLYTSRVVLDVLGIDDYGVYNLVASVVVSFSFLNNSLSGATSRFITYELGTGDTQKLSRTFTSTVIVHIALALVIILLCETIGVWMLNYKLSIPEDSVTTANWLLQLSILSTAIGITQIPYNALIIAHERMQIFAYLEILNSLLKFGIVLLLIILPGNKLLLYAILSLAVSLLIMSIYRIYCIREFKESKFRFLWDKDILKKLITFSGWDMFGNGCVVASQQGMNFILNIFMGVAINAANGIATIVSGTIKGFAGNIIMTYRPQIVIQYAQNQIKILQELMCDAIKYSLILLAIMAVPLFIELDFILGIWLTDVPAYASDLCRIQLLVLPFNLITMVLGASIHATGNIKRISFFSGFLIILGLPVTYFLLKLGVPLTMAYSTIVFAMIANMISNIIIIKIQINRLEIRPIIIAILKSLLLIFLTSYTLYLASESIQDSWLKLIIIILSYLIILTFSSLLVLFNSRERNSLFITIKSKLYHGKTQA